MFCKVELALNTEVGRGVDIFIVMASSHVIVYYRIMVSHMQEVSFVSTNATPLWVRQFSCKVVPDMPLRKMTAVDRGFPRSFRV